MRRPSGFVLLALLVAAPFFSAADDGSSSSWLQWGGPSRDFHAPAGDLASNWPEEGPRELWSRSLGDGQSAVLYENGRLYTMLRRVDDEVVVCLDAATGETLWETAYHSPYEGMGGYGTGPRATPLLVGNRLFTVGVMGRMHALDKSDGTVLWSHDLWGETFGGNRLGHGYSSSPLAYGETVIVPVGGKGAALVAFEQATGEIRWQAHDFRNSYSSPSLETIGGEEQMLIFMRGELVALDPSDGTLHWRWPHENQWGHNITMPTVYDDTIFFSSPQAGARGLKVVSNGDGVELEQLWSTRRVQFYHAATVQDGDWVYGSTGATSPAFMTAINIRTGEVGWKQRGFAKANLIEADGRLLILDENGVLYLADASPDELVVRSKTKLLDRFAWTVPTLVGRTLYLRDQNRILAVDLG